MLANETPQNTEDFVALTPENNWVSSIASYFRDFLDTDFKRTSAPKRQISSRDSSGILTGVPLSKYPELTRDLWKLLGEPFDTKMVLELRIRRGKYRSRLSEFLLEVINQHVNSVDGEKIAEIIDAVKASARENRKRLAADPERYADYVLSQLKSALLLAIVNPLLTNLDTFFENQGNESLETIYNLEEELGDLLVDPLLEPIPVVIASAIVNDNYEEFDKLVEETCQLGLIRMKLINYFEGFTTSDFHRDLSELSAMLKLKENFQIYVYVGALRFGKTSYPIFYFPVEVELSESIYTIRIDPHLLINKKAIDFGVSEVNREINRPIAFSLSERIVYIGQGETFLTHIQDTLDEFTNALAMDGGIDLHDSRPQKIARSQISIDNSLHFAAFDQSDESLLNDYEELLELLNGESLVGEEFKALVMGFMTEDPVSLEDHVSEKWLNTTLPDRLVYDSPVPLNEEQRKILFALNTQEGKYIAVEGPPGTGKSHTITAVVFDAILKNRNVLILSDKKEALNVAEQKIKETLKTVRVGDNFQDPILRLGKQGNTYAKILAVRTIDQIHQSHQVFKAKKGEFEKDIDNKERSLKKRIAGTSTAATAIEMKRIIALQEAEKHFDYLTDDSEFLFRHSDFRRGVLAAETVANILLLPEIQSLLTVNDCEIQRGPLEKFLDFQRKMMSAANTCTITGDMKSFRRFEVANLPELGRAIDDFQDAKKPIVGFLFSGKRVRRIARRLTDKFNYRSAVDAHKHIDRLRWAEQGFRDVIDDLERINITAEADINVAFYQMMQNLMVSSDQLTKLSEAYTELINVLDHDENGLFAKIGISAQDLSALGTNEGSEVLSRLKSLANHLENFEEICQRFGAIPEMDYAEELRDLENLHTSRLADTLDGRVVAFANKKRNKAAQIKTIIQKKQKFPKDLFADLREAFPVMIAGIRDYAEYVPLERELFDLIIIDEASQVSIAQALPAFVRAKKVLVLGDRNQFSNVKTANASKMINQFYKARTVEQFRREESPDVALLNQIKIFDIKTSILEFVERIANLKIMLKKHFRGYPEIIGFSSKYFYGGALQAVKIRGKPIDEVIEFVKLEHDGLHEIKGNTNLLEADAVIDRLKTLGYCDNPPDVCVITPFNEQQRLILERMRELPDGINLSDSLRLRVFTFDTCQGEEAEVCIYSMVATPHRDRLNYIFAKDITKGHDVEEKLRLQRLNVGFSRAKERIIIFHSKPIQDMQGGIQIALSHYRGVLEKGREGPEVDEVDPNSPMELRVLNWLREIPLFNELGERVEIDAQFELGAYLRQLDSSYTHPNYKVDFLIKVRGEREIAQIVIEYDGFKEHFDDLDEVDEANFEFYMKPEDVERQKILEGYGYRFIRINRFTIGDDPVKTIDDRLRKMLAKIDIEREPPKLIEEQKKLQEALNNKDSKACSRCYKIKPLPDFFDQTLKKGKGGYGRVCRFCKGISPTKPIEEQNQTNPFATQSEDRIYLNCPYSEKDECKKRGGQWDPFKKKWYVPANVSPALFSRWMQTTHQQPTNPQQ